MLAFLKRRWFLLSFAGVLLGFSVMAEELWTRKNAGDESDSGKRQFSPKLDGNAAKRG